ncbi:MAG: efflux RND transporter periplasmic adaptor subunit [Holophagaceae bacterium]|nr:efflux RND transporter periplasmic adaptor subunit [Holophagaceae bacterium]
MNPKPILLTAATGFLALGLACGKHAESPTPTLPTVAVRLVADASPAGAGWVAATLQRTDQATLSTRLAGTVKRVLVTEGSAVASGQLLMELEAGDLLGQLKAAQSGREAAQGYHRRIKALQAQGAATPSELEQAASQLAQAEAAVAAVQGQLAFAQIRAPFAGTVQRRDVQPGAFVGPGQPLLTLEGRGSLELTATLSEAEAAGLPVGRRVAFDADGRVGQAVVIALAPGGDALTHRQALRAKVLQPSDLRSGAFARIQVPAAAKASGAEVGPVRVPATALVRRGELTGVFVEEGGKALLRWISLGERDGDQVEARAGLNRTDRVIADPAGLQDGQPVRVESAPKEDARHGR